MFALIELDHGDLGPLFKSRGEALDALREIENRVPWEADAYGIVELDKDGFPVTEPTERASARR